MTGSSVTRVSMDETGTPKWHVPSIRPYRPLSWGEKFEVSKHGKVKVNKSAPKFGTHDMDPNFGVGDWAEAMWRNAEGVNTDDYFELALIRLRRESNQEATDVSCLSRLQRKLFFDRVQHGKIRTPFMDLVLAKAMAIRMGGMR